MRLGIECLRTDDATLALQLAQQLDAINRERRTLETGMREQALLIAESLMDSEDEPPPALCVYDEEFHEGVVGIVAGRLKDLHYRPCFVFAASECWRADKREHEHYSDSGGKSGGQKEKLAYTILAASLAYQFGLEWGAARSRSFRFVVIDEADRLLEMGFEAEVSALVGACPVGRQTLLFSATMTARVEDLAKLSLRRPVRVEADPLHDMAGRLVQEFVRVRAGREADREALLLALLDRSFTGGGVLVFTGKKHAAHRLAILLGLAGLNAAELHGNLTQRARLEALEAFRTGAADILVATDLAGRGLDIAGVRVVINDDMPRDLSTYVHRVGRTARAGRAGVSVTLVAELSRALMKEVVKRAALNVRARAVPPDVVAAYRARNRKLTLQQELEKEEREAAAAKAAADAAALKAAQERAEIDALPAAAKAAMFHEKKKKVVEKGSAMESIVEAIQGYEIGRAHV
jgi:hypothetical protein